MEISQNDTQDPLYRWIKNPVGLLLDVLSCQTRQPAKEVKLFTWQTHFKSCDHFSEIPGPFVTISSLHSYLLIKE